MPLNLDIPDNELLGTDFEPGSVEDAIFWGDMPALDSEAPFWESAEDPGFIPDYDEGTFDGAQVDVEDVGPDEETEFWDSLAEAALKDMDQAGIESATSPEAPADDGGYGGSVPSGGDYSASAYTPPAAVAPSEAPLAPESTSPPLPPQTTPGAIAARMRAKKQKERPRKASGHGKTRTRVRGDVARGDLAASVIPTAIPGVTDEAWTRFVRTCATATPTSVSPSNCLGMFEMSPRRLADLGFVENLTRKVSPQSQRPVWVGDLAIPTDKYLQSPALQYGTFALSMRDYAKRINSGEIPMPGGTSLAGALAVLHRAGPRGLDSWARGERFPDTARLRERVEGIF